MREESPMALAELNPADCPLVRDPELVDQFNEIVGRLEKLQNQTAPPEAHEEVRQLLAAGAAVRGRLTRSRYQVGLLGRSQVGKSTTLNRVLDAAEDETPAREGRSTGGPEMAPGGFGHPTVGTALRLRPISSGANSLALRYLTPDEYQARRRLLLEEDGIDPTVTDDEVLRMLAERETSLRLASEAPEFGAWSRHVRSLLLSHARYGRDLVREPALEQAVSYADRYAYLGHHAPEGPSPSFLLRDAVIRVRTRMPFPDLELVDLPGLGGTAAHAALSQSVLADLDAALVFGAAETFATAALDQLLDLLRRSFEGDVGRRVWVVITKFDSVGQLFRGTPGEKTGFDYLTDFLERHRIPPDRLCLVSNRLNQFQRETTRETGVTALPADAALAVLGLSGNDLVLEQLEARAELRPAYEELLQDGGIDRLRQVLSLLPRQAERGLRTWAAERLAEMGDRLTRLERGAMEEERRPPPADDPAARGFGAEVVLTRYPAPVAVAYRRCLQQQDPPTRLSHVFAALEATLRYLVALAVCDLFQCLALSGEPGAQLPADSSFDFLRRPRRLTPGQWAVALRETARALAGRPGRFFPELPGVARLSSGDGPLAELISLRNWTVHSDGAQVLGAEECAAVLRQARPLLDQALHEVRFIAAYPLAFARIRFGLTDRPEPQRFYLHSCMGARVADTEQAYVLEARQPFQEDLPFVVAPDNSRLLYLWPLLRQRVSETTGRHTLFVFEEIAGKGQAFLTQVRYAAIDVREVWEETLQPAPAASHAWLFQRLRGVPAVVALPPDTPLAQHVLSGGHGALVGRSLGGIRLQSVLARGGFATLYVGATPSGLRVCVKVLETHAFVRTFPRFRREFDKLRQLGGHPGILRCYEAGAELIDGREYPWYSMEFAAGGDLGSRDRDRASRAGDRPPWDDAALRAEIIREFDTILDTVAYLHGLGIVHRDIKPGNVLIMEDGSLRLADFGLVKELRPSRGPHEDPTSAGAVVGTPRYMGPEQLRGQVVSAAADVYSLGVLFAELATGKPPESEGSPPVGSPLAGWRPLASLPLRARQFVLRCTDVDPARRPRAAADMAAEFRRVAATESESQEHAPQAPAQARQPRVRAHTWYLRPEADVSTPLLLGQDWTFTLRLMPNEQSGAVPLTLAESTLEATVYLEAPGFQLDGEHVRTLAVVAGTPVDRELSIRLRPLSAGTQAVRVLVYTGSRIAGLSPAEVVQQVQVERTRALPNIRELLDPRAIPDPQPDVFLHVALQDAPSGEQLAYHVTCPALRLDREPLGPPLSLTRRDLAGVRRLAIEAAVGAAAAAPGDGLAALRAAGGLLFDRLVPRGHPLRAFYREAVAAARPRPWSWLFVADAEALLPWELVCPYGARPDTREVWHDDFLGGRFLVGHWVGREGLALAAEAPRGRIDLTHYGQRPAEQARWLAALGGADHADAEAWQGPFALTAPGSPHYGLHVVRYADPRREGRITAAEDAALGDRGQPDARLHNQRLDFTLKRPVVGLSFVDDWPAVPYRGVAEAETSLEAGWVLPLLRAGASALVGPRWPVPPAAERLFLRAYHAASRAGAPLGWAVWEARRQVRLAFPGRPDWLAWAYFGHPDCQLYAVRPAQGFTLFEALGHPEGRPFVAGRPYRFRASYRSQAPVWYHGRLRVAPAILEGGAVTVAVVPLLPGLRPLTCELQPVPGNTAYDGVLELTMPRGEESLPLLVYFRQGRKELETLELALDLAEVP
jgi:serine/threonine protein kinase